MARRDIILLELFIDLETLQFVGTGFGLLQRNGGRIETAQYLTPAVIKSRGDILVGWPPQEIPQV